MMKIITRLNVKLLLLFVSFLALTACKVSSNIVTETDVTNTPPRKIDKHYILYVKGGYDDVCQEEIEKATKYLPGVRFAYWVQGEQKLLIDFDETQINIDSISLAIARRGYDTERHRADDSVYKTLPFQCRYR